MTARKMTFEELRSALPYLLIDYQFHTLIPIIAPSKLVRIVDEEYSENDKIRQRLDKIAAFQYNLPKDDSEEQQF